MVKYLVAIRVKGKRAQIYQFDNKHDRAMFVDAIARTDMKDFTYAFSETE